MSHSLSGTTPQRGFPSRCCHHGKWSKTSVRDDGEIKKQHFDHHENVLLAMVIDEQPHIRQFELKSWRQYDMCLQQNSQISSATARRDRISWHDRSSDISSDDASCYDLLDEQRIEGHEPGSNFTKCPLPSLPLSHTQEVERCVKPATAALAAVWGETPHHRFMQAVAASR